MSKNTTKRKIKTSSIIGVLVGIAFIAVGIYNIIASRIDAKEYQNTTDIRTVSALVIACDWKGDTDSDGKEYTTAYDLKISFEVDGKPYTAKGMISASNSAFREDLRKGDIIDIQVYRTSKGKYKITPDNDPVDFLLAWAMIPLGAVFFLGVAHDLNPKIQEQTNESPASRRQKRGKGR